MINTEEFVKRLEVLFETYGLTSSTFADKIGVQRSTLSHLLSGRNKPSLDFILKIIDVFPEVDLYWILNGKGKLVIDATSLNMKKSSETNNLVNELQFPEVKGKSESIVHSNTIEKLITEEIKIATDNLAKKTERIIIFYNDGTFKEFFPE